MPKPNDAQTKLFASTTITLITPTISGEILYCIKTSAGKPWAEVTWVEAMGMIARADGLRQYFTDAELRQPELQAMVDDGRLAEGLLGPLPVRDVLAVKGDSSSGKRRWLPLEVEEPSHESPTSDVAVLFRNIQADWACEIDEAKLSQGDINTLKHLMTTKGRRYRFPGTKGRDEQSNNANTKG